MPITVTVKVSDGSRGRFGVYGIRNRDKGDNNLLVFEEEISSETGRLTVNFSYPVSIVKPLSKVALISG